ncbi:hypothetical protein [Escherichia coli]|uniref:hypothetical protein n=1 Tax=Escherichia coli TaxID=562 RepID=UPI0038B3BED9
MKPLVYAVILSLTTFSAFAKQNSANSQKAGASNIERQSYENTDAGKKQAEWIAMNRIGWSEGCK